MGDRTTVELTVLKSQSEQARSVFIKADGEENDSWYLGNVVITYQFDEVNYGELRCLNDLLKAGIAFNSAWSTGNEYGSGTEYCRFDADGDYIRTTVYNDERNPNLESLIELINKPTELIKYLLNYKEKVCPLPWDNQEQYGKIYRTKKLLLPNTEGLVASY